MAWRTAKLRRTSESGKRAQHAGEPAGADDLRRAHSSSAISRISAATRAASGTTTACASRSCAASRRPTRNSRPCDRAEHAERAPDERAACPPRQGDRIRAERVELPGDEIELAGKVPQNELEHCGAIFGVGGHLAEHRECEQEKGKQRQQRVVGDRRRVGEIVAVVEAEESAPERQRRQPPRCRARGRGRAAPLSQGHYVRRAAPTEPTHGRFRPAGTAARSRPARARSARGARRGARRVGEDDVCRRGAGRDEHHVGDGACVALVIG